MTHCGDFMVYFLYGIHLVCCALAWFGVMYQKVEAKKEKIYCPALGKYPAVFISFLLATCFIFSYLIGVTIDLRGWVIPLSIFFPLVVCLLFSAVMEPADRGGFVFDFKNLC